MSWGTAELKSYEAEKYQGKHCCEPALCQGWDTGLGEPSLCPSVVLIMFIHWKSASEIELGKKAEIKEESSAHLCI